MALEAGDLQVNRGMSYEEGFEADGEVRLVGSHVGGDLYLGGKFRNDGRDALNAQRVRVDGSLHWAPR